MLVGVPKEVKDNEYRVGLVPTAVTELVRHGHEVIVESGAGAGIGCSDESYLAAGARITDADTIFANAELLIKVKEPLADERRKLRRGQVLFTYLHLAPDLEQTKDLLATGVTAIAYETVTAANGTLPLLTPMSEVAGRLAPQIGAYCLEKSQGGLGILLGGVPGVLPAEVVIVGGGVSGSHAAQIASGMGANVTVFDRSAEALRRINVHLGTAVRTAFSTHDLLAAAIHRADLLIGAVLVPGGTTPKVVTREMIASMKAGTVFVDIAIDQGGCSETSKPTSHSAPTYVVDGVTHYCVTNMPGAVARTSTFALNNATLPFALALADKGWKRALSDDPHLLNGLNVHDGKLTCAPVAEAQGIAYVPAESVLA